MGRVTLRLPRLGETMEEARVTDWLLSPGAAFKRGDVLVEVETDKTVVEVPAMTDGILLEHLVHPGDVVALDQPIAVIDAEGQDDPPPITAALPDPQVAPLAPVAMPHAQAGPRPAASPAARAAARRLGTDLARITGTGRRGRITAEDVTQGQPSGAALPIILLHGLFDDARGWRDLPRRMAQAGHTVHALDLPGHGDSPPCDTLADAVTQIAQTVTAIVPQGRLRLVGHSLGAALAVKVALMLPGRVDRLVLCAPAGIGARINADFTDGMLAAQTPAALARALALLDAGPISASGLEQELIRVQAQRVGHARLAAAVASKGFQQIDITADLARLTCDLRVVFGTADRVLDWRDVENLPAAACLHLLRGAGHLPHHGAADLLLSLVTDQGKEPAIRV